MDYRLTSYAHPGELTKVTELHAHGKTAVICRDDCGRYWGIPAGYIVEDRLVCRLNGIMGNLSETLEACLEATTRAFHMEELTAQGVDVPVAALMVCEGLTREEAEARWVEALAKNGKEKA